MTDIERLCLHHYIVFWLVLFVQVRQVSIGAVQDSRTRVIDFFLRWEVLVDSDYWSCIQVSILLIVSYLLPNLLGETGLIMFCLFIKGFNICLWFDMSLTSEIVKESFSF